ncbi:Exostosin-like [Macleaya cordata]|uniref:Exostosin-like n=1 Tax=Macleaya cordata TaxID=56857 RepID=A0A200RC21_MACCD|nr:Exostosin-like [Macleaya cordata]OVA20268.1 Exostosin-like [Macleaya cordata]
MDYALKFQKLCQLKAMKLLLVLGIIASILVMQSSFTLPYGNVLSSLYTSGKVLLPGKSGVLVSDASPKSDMVGKLHLLDNSLAPDSSVVPGEATNMEVSAVEEETEHDDVSKGTDEDPKNELATEEDGDLDHDFEFDGERDPDKNAPSPSKVIELDKNSRSPNSQEQVDISSLGNTREPKEGSPVEQVRKSDNEFSLDNVQKEDNGLTLEKVVSGDTGSVFPPVASAPLLPLNNLSSLVLDARPTTSIISVNSNISPVGNKADEPLSKNEESGLVLQGGPVTRTNDVTLNKNTAIAKYNEEMPTPSVTSISEMSHILIQSRSTSQSMKPRWSSARDKEILFARSRIENAPIIKNDRELYAPLFRNISMFKRSYELMERMLKVYVYKEGQRPIFHSPPLKGIYASEGWFMKQMEGNKRFVVKDPRKAHLFYLPFSTRALQYTLYVPNSHSHKNLIEYLKNYLDTLVAKYPFWNRTGGADHFLAACHDWAPTETNDYMSSCIRALCNADVNVGFKIGKDASLPETYVRNARNPLRYLGGEPPSKRKILAFFAGGMHGYLRPILLKYWENKDPDMHIYGPMGGGKKNKMNYIQSMKTSKYCICAKGFEVNSPRVVEAIFFECVPVIISDNFVPPFFEVLDWEKFAVFVPEKDIPNLKNILLSIPEQKYLAMQMKVKKVQQHFLWHIKPVKYDVFHMILHSIWYNRVFQITNR